MNPTYRQPGFAGLVLSAGLVAVGVANWSHALPPATTTSPVIQGRREGEGLIPPSDPDAESWLKKASDAAVEGQWKLAADTLARVIEQYGDKTVSPDGRQYFSALNCAQQQIAAWPEEGLGTYRLLYDALVRQQLDRARMNSDVDSIREIAQRYPMTTHGPEAMSLLADRLIDMNRAPEALWILRKLQLSPHSKIPAWSVLGKIVMAYCAAQEYGPAEQTLAELKRFNGVEAKLPVDWPKRFEKLSQFVARGSKDAGSIAQPFPLARGAGSDPAFAPLIEPAVTPEAPWHDYLPGAGRIDEGLITRIIKNTGRPPVWQAASDGRAIFFSSPEGIVARDLSSFELLWKTFPRTLTRDPQIDAIRQRMGIGEMDNRDRLDELSTRTLFHEYRGALTTAMGLVFMIEQGPAMDELFPSRDGIAPSNDRVALEPNSIRAFEADTGRALWTLGRGSAARRADQVARRTAEKPLGNRDGAPIDSLDLRSAHFFSPPVPAGDLLVAPFQLENDFYLAVLRRDGSIERHVLIGTGQSGMMPVNAVLTPLVQDDTIYVPTGAGLFVALSRFDFSLKWLTMYDRSRSKSEAGMRRAIPFGPVQQPLTQPDEWVASAPLPAGSVIMLAAQDSNQLQAFDKLSGQVKWSFPRGDYRYVIGTDGSRVFVAGSALLAIDLSNGMGVWSQTKYKPTGRTLVCDRTSRNGTRGPAAADLRPDTSMLLVPTEQGLVRLDGQSGQQVGEMLPSMSAMGNLTYLDGALYSIGAKQIAKYPDLDQSRLAALVLLKKNPQDFAALLRLAWLAKLKKNWAEALELLDQSEKAFAHTTTAAGRGSKSSDFSPGTFLRPDPFPDRIAHQRVEILLKLAASAKDNDRADLIHRAVKSAISPEDLVLAGLALVDLLGDQERRFDAFKIAMDLVGRVGAEPLALEPELIAVASIPLRETLQRLWNEADAATRSKMEVGLDDAIGQALERFDPRHCGQISDALGFCAKAGELDLAIARRCRESQGPECAAFYLERAARRGIGTRTGRDALLQQFILYADPGPDLPVATTLALSGYERLVREYQMEIVPADVVGIPEELINKPITSLLTRYAIGPGKPADVSLPEILQNDPALELASESVVPNASVRDTSAFVDRRNVSGGIGVWRGSSDMVLLRIARQIRAVDIRGEGSEVYWTSNLEPSIETMESTANTLPVLQPEDAVFSGYVGVFAAGRQICGVGMASGSALWPSIPIEGEKKSLPKPFVLEHNGVILLADQPDTLTAMYARTDSRPRWRRRFPSHRIASLGSAGDYFVAIDEQMNTVFVIDPESGRIFRQVDISEGQSSPEAEEAAVDGAGKSVDAYAVIVGRSICRSGHKKVVTRDILTGRKMWELPLKGRVTRLMRLDDQHVGICYRGQHFAIVRVESGEIIRDELLEGLVMPPEDATLDARAGPDGGRVLLFANTEDDPPEFALVSIPLRESGQIWKRPLGRLPICNMRMMRMSPRFVPVIQVQLQSGAGRNLFAQGGAALDAQRLEFYDKQSGRKLLQQPYTFDAERFTNETPLTRIMMDVIVLERRIITVCAEGYSVLRKSEGSKTISLSPGDKP